MDPVSLGPERPPLFETGKADDTLYSNLFENNHAVMLLIDPVDGAIADANPAACAFYGWRREAFKGLTIYDINTLTPPEIADQMARARMQKRTSFCFRHRRADGSIRDVEVHSGPLVLEGRNLLFSIVHDVTGRNEIQASLAESERRLATLMANLPGMAYRCQNDAQWTMLFVSDGCLDLTGYPARELLQNRGTSYADLIHPRDRQAVWDQVQDRLRQRTPFNLTYRIRTAAGEEKWVMEKGQGVFSAAGALLALEGFVSDITQRNRAEEALRQSEEKFRLAFQTSPDAINLNRLSDGLYLDINDGFTQLTGFTREDAIGRTSLEITVWDDPQDRACLIAALREKGFVENFEARFRRKSGEVRIGLMSARVLRLNQQDIILSVTRDITERKRVEDALRETEKNYRELAESLPQVIFEIDANGRLTYINRTGYRLFGYSPNEIPADFNVLDAIAPEDRERVTANILNDGRSALGLNRRDYTGIKKDGTRFPVGIHAKGIRRGDVAAGLRGILIDLTPVRRAEEEKRKLELRLQQAQKMEAIGVLAGGIAHDFNNILAAIIGYVELARLNSPDGHGAMELGRALAATQRARDLVKQILAFSRQSDEERVPVRVAMVVKEAIRFLRATIPATVEIQTRLSDPNGTVMASSVEIHQIVMNLCTNAVHALGGQPGRLEIEICAVEIPPGAPGGIRDLESGPYVRIAVTDTGCGMSPGVAQRIFDPYFTTKEKGVGTGLGLAVVHGIVTKYGGAVRLDTAAGKGSTFHVFLPKADLAGPLKTEAPESIAGGSGRILFVDDEKTLADIADQALRRLGFEVETRTSPIEALELFRAKPRHFDLVITDQTMPGMTGEALAAEITRLRPEIPVILCTGYSQALNKQQFQQRGIRSLVMKPMLITELAAAIREVLPS